MAKHTTEELDIFLREQVVRLAKDQEALEEEIRGKEERANWLQGEAERLEQVFPEPRKSEHQRDIDNLKHTIPGVIQDKDDLDKQLAKVVHDIECLADLRELALPGTSQPVVANVGSD